MSRVLLIVVTVILCVVLGGLVYFAMKPVPIQSEKVSIGKSLELVKTYPENSSGLKKDYFTGKLYKAGKINVVVMEGTYKEMGKQYGALLKDELNANYNGMIEGLKNIKSFTVESFQDFGNMIYDSYPEKYQQIVNGLAESSGLGTEKAKFLLGQESYVYAALLELAKGENISGSAHCSGLATWGDYTGGGPLVFGRNYDLGPVNHENAMLAIYNPIDGSIPSSSFTFAGAIYTTTGMNRDGLFLELNNGSASDNADYTGIRTWTPLTVFSFLEQSKNLNQVDVAFNSTLPDLSYIINAADPKYAYSFEWSTNGVKKKEPDKAGLMAATNLFFDPAWGPQSYDFSKDPDAVVIRRDNLLKLAEANKGNINVSKMMEIISTPLKDGGSFRDPNLTSYEIVAVPETLKMWLRIPEYQDWVEVNLAEYFNK